MIPENRLPEPTIDREAAIAWIQSPEGQAAMEQARKNADETIKKLHSGNGIKFVRSCSCPWCRRY